jgi:CBS domain-containing protein
MRDRHVGCLVVVEERDGGRAPVGILTDRDFVVGPIAAGLDDLEKLTVDDVMVRDLVVVRLHEDLWDVLERMRAHGVRRVPVVDDRDLLQGIIAIDDVLELLTDEMGKLVALVRREQLHERRPAGT